MFAVQLSYKFESLFREPEVCKAFSEVQIHTNFSSVFLSFMFTKVSFMYCGAVFAVEPLHSIENDLEI